MNIRHVQECKSRGGWLPVRVVSSKDPDKHYTVFVNPWDEPEENICECPGYVYNGSCRHQALASARLCGWSEIEGPETQDETQRRGKVCPRCLQPTQWTMEIDESRT